MPLYSSPAAGRHFPVNFPLEHALYHHAPTFWNTTDLCTPLKISNCISTPEFQAKL
jgi:hypothetical protein